jgi:hypothetical protein
VEKGGGREREREREFVGGRATVVWGWWVCLFFLGIYARDILWDLNWLGSKTFRFSIQ